MNIHTNSQLGDLWLSQIYWFFKRPGHQYGDDLAFRRISRERLKQGSRNVIYLSRTIGLINLPDMTSPAPSGRLQNASKSCILHKSAQNGSSLTNVFKLESPKLAGTSMPTWSKALADMTWPAASGRHLSKFEKGPKMSHRTVLFASLMQYQGRLKISRVKHICNVFELSDVSFR